VRELVNHVKTLETHDKESSATALLLASSTRNWRVVEVLLQKGALISVQDLSSNSALHRVQHAKGGLEVSKLLLKHPGQQGIKIDQKNINNKTALYLACEMGNGQMVELLLAHGADPNMAGPADCTPLHCAIDFRRVKIVKALLEWGADVSVKDGRGRDAGKAARTRNQSPEIKKLVAEWEGKTGGIGCRRGSASTQRRSIHSTTSELVRVPSGG
jgi:ankyrin repeat protein